MEHKKVVVFTGAGISAESGLQTFRDGDGLWENHHIEDVCTPEAWARQPDLVQAFYNDRREAVIKAQPNAAHHALARLSELMEVMVITQNIDDLHERAGSQNVLHLHGQVRHAQSSIDARLTYPIEGHELSMAAKCELGSPLRPHVVFFGEAVPNMDVAMGLARQADILLVVGTSLSVYPAANLIYEVPSHAQKVLIDPAADQRWAEEGFLCIPERASIGLPRWVEDTLGVVMA
ncbi:MAG: NAD-dependent deacylase [Neisseriaceae bacterium]|nr:NAD-dependent deacylase [Neisseriaceae bacterium]MBP6863276.1 NAD-dependent deacylase [Neisseriaceae bacterium]